MTAKTRAHTSSQQCYLWLDPRTHATIHIEKSTMPLDELFDHHIDNPHAHPLWFDQLLWEIRLSEAEPKIFRIPLRQYEKATSSLHRYIRGVPGAKDPILICDLLNEDEHVTRTPPLTEQQAYDLLVMYHVDQLTTSEIMKRTGTKKAALHNVRKGRRHKGAFQRFHREHEQDRGSGVYTPQDPS